MLSDEDNTPSSTSQGDEEDVGDIPPVPQNGGRYDLPGLLKIL
jgi:hypothetical protein